MSARERGDPAGRRSPGPAIAFGLLADALLRDTPLGLNVPLWTAAYVAVLVALAFRHGRSLRGDRALMLSALLPLAALFA